MEEKNNLIDRIEKLFLDGNKDVILHVDKKIEEAKNDSLNQVDRKFEEAKSEILNKVGRKFDQLEKVVSSTAQASYGLLTDVRGDVKEVKDTLDKHVRLPAHA